MVDREGGIWVNRANFFEFNVLLHELVEPELHLLYRTVALAVRGCPSEESSV